MEGEKIEREYVAIDGRVDGRDARSLRGSAEPVWGREHGERPVA